MMQLPVFERFAELGWQPFVDPAETFEFFSVSGVFRRANVDVTSRQGEKPCAKNLLQRCALFDVCLKSGLAHLMVAYIRAEESQVQPKGAFAGVKKYVLKEPIAVQQWLRRRLETTEQHVNEIVSEQHFHGHESPRTDDVEEELRHLNGLRMILIALTERLNEGSRQAAHSFDNTDAEGNAVDKTELIRLTSAGIQNLLQLLSRTHAAACACHCMLWLNENEVATESEVYNAFYSKARSLRNTYRKQFEEIYGRNLSSVGGSKEPMLLIEHVMKSASISLNNLGGSCPPTQLTHLFQLLSTSSIQADVVQFYGDEVDREPIEGYFRVPVALLLYFCLDRAYLSVWKQHTQSGARIATKMRSLADSFAAQLSVRGDMKLTLLALWLVENAVVVKTSGDDQVAAIYAHAVGLLQQSSAMHLHQKYDLEADLILHLLETLVHRGESLVAWNVWNTFGIELNQSPPAATELLVVISLELESWERALSLIRRQKRPDLLDLLFDWLVKSHRLKELVEGATLLSAEEKLFHTYMMESNVITDEDVLRDDNIKRVDFLVMYYILRNKFEQAWDVHHDHLAMIRAMSRGDTDIAKAALNQPSLRIRAALLSNMCLEPSPKPYPQRSKNVNVGTKIQQRQHSIKTSLLKNEEMEDVSDFDAPAPTLSAPTDSGSMEVCTEDRQVTSAGSALVCAKTEQLTHSQEMAKAREFYYSPGIFSSQQGSSGPTHSMEPPTSLVDKKTPTPMKGRGQGKGSVGGTSAVSVDSSPNSPLHTLTKLNPIVTNSTGSARQALNFGTSPPKPSSALQPFVSPFGDRRPLGTGPIRTKISPTFAFTSLQPLASKAPGSTNDLSLKPRNIESTTDDISPAEAQSFAMVATNAPENRTAQQAVTPPPDSASPVVAVTSKRYQFVRELSTDPPRLDVVHSNSEYPISPATQELEDMMELEHIDEEFSTPISRSRGRQKEPASAPPVRRNPRRSTRQKY